MELPLSTNLEVSEDLNLLPDDVMQILLNQSYKLLYVEDNQVNLKLMESVFEKIPNMELISTNNGESGIELAKFQKPDLIILDIHLSGIDGYEVFKRLTADEEIRNIPVVALSANAMEADIEKGIALGFSDYFTKPLDIQLFMKKIFNLLHDLG